MYIVVINNTYRINASTEKKIFMLSSWEETFNWNQNILIAHALIAHDFHLYSNHLPLIHTRSQFHPISVPFVSPTLCIVQTMCSFYVQASSVNLLNPVSLYVKTNNPGSLRRNIHSSHYCKNQGLRLYGHPAIVVSRI